MDKGAAILKRVELIYDPKKMSVKAKRILLFTDGHEEQKLINGMDAINGLLKLFAENEGQKVFSDPDKLKVDSRLSDDAGAVVFDADNGYRKIFFDRENGEFLEKRLTRSERAELGLLGGPLMDDEPVTETSKTLAPSVTPEPATREDDIPSTLAPVTPAETPAEDDHVVVDEDGSVLATSESTPAKEEKKEKPKGINLRTLGIGALVLLVGGAIVAGSIKNAAQNNLSNTNNYNVEMDVEGTKYTSTYSVSYDDSNVTYTDSDSLNDTDMTFEYISDDSSQTYRYVSLGCNAKYDDMEDLIQAINDMCFEYSSCQLENLVVDTDRAAIQAVSGMRNKVLNNSIDSNSFMNNAISYIFENSTNFDNQTIKKFNSLTPYAKYIVLVATESMLNTDYNYTTSQNNYNYDVLIDSFDYMVNDVYRILTSNKNKSM